MQVKKRAEKDEFFDQRKGQMLTEKDPGKTFFILFTSPDSLLTLSMQRELLDLKDHIEVHSYFSRGESDLIQLVEDNSRCNFFLDEVLVHKSSISPSTIARMSQIIAESNYLWIACQSDKLPNLQDEKFKGLPYKLKS